MIAIEEARARILAPLRPTGTEMVPLAAACGRVLAGAVLARRTQPPADVSAMDGFAVRAAAAAAGARLRLVGSAPAGHPFAGRIEPGETVAVFTGSLLPEGADAVLIQEDAEREGGEVRVGESVRPGQHVRPRGQDFTAGERLLAPGRRLTARDVGLAAAADHPWIAVHRRPVVAVLATGDEIALPGEEVPAGGIVSSNSHALAALVGAAGGEARVLPIVPDDVEAIAAATERLGAVDLLVTTGGASVGAHDLVREGLARRGLALDFWKVAMRPGKPLMHGRVAGVPLLGLPGNPVSALVCATLFLLPALARLAGEAGWALPMETALLGAPLPANDRRADHLRARLEHDAAGRLTVTPFARQDSSLQRLLAEADGLLFRPADAPALAPGAEVPVLRFSNLGI